MQVNKTQEVLPRGNTNQNNTRISHTDTQNRRTNGPQTGIPGKPIGNRTIEADKENRPPSNSGNPVKILLTEEKVHESYQRFLSHKDQSIITSIETACDLLDNPMNINNALLRKILPSLKYLWLEYSPQEMQAIFGRLLVVETLMKLSGQALPADLQKQIDELRWTYNSVIAQ